MTGKWIIPPTTLTNEEIEARVARELVTRALGVTSAPITLVPGLKTVRSEDGLHRLYFGVDAVVHLSGPNGPGTGPRSKVFINL